MKKKLILPILLAALVLVLWQRSPHRSSSRTQDSLAASAHLSRLRPELQALPQQPSPTTAPDPVASLQNGTAFSPGSNAVSNRLFDVASWLAGGRIVEEEQGAPGPDGVFQKTKIVELDFKFPFLRVVESWRGGTAGAAPVLVRRSVMAADHLLVKVRGGGAAEATLRRLASGLPHASWELMRGSKAYKLNLGTVSLAGWNLAMTRLQAQPEGALQGEPDYLRHASAITRPNDAKFSRQWHLSSTNAGANYHAMDAWSITTGKSNVVVAVLDSGIDYTHGDLKNNLWINRGEKVGNHLDDDGNSYPDDLRGWNFYFNYSDTRDDSFHGTHVAGIIGAQANNKAGVSGVVWKIQLMAVKVLGKDGFGVSSDLVEGIYYAIDNGAWVINASLGGGDFSLLEREAVAQAGQAGVLFIASSGNEGEDNDVRGSYPASYDLANLISVAAVDQNGRLADFSNFHSRNACLIAPGVGIYSTTPLAATATMIKYRISPAYAPASGTSMAAPFVSGAAALLMSQHPDWSLAQVRHQLLHSPSEDPLRTAASLGNGCLTLDLLRLLQGETPQPSTPLELRSIGFLNPLRQEITQAEPNQPVGIVADFSKISGISDMAWLEVLGTNQQVTVLSKGLYLDEKTPGTWTLPQPFWLRVNPTVTNTEITLRLLLHYDFGEWEIPVTLPLRQGVPLSEGQPISPQQPSLAIWTAGPAQNGSVRLNASIALGDEAWDQLTFEWLKFSGPGPVTFSEPNNWQTVAHFERPGDYVLNLSMTFGSLSYGGSVQVLVPDVPPMVSISTDVHTVSEGDILPVDFFVRRTGSLASPLDVTYSVVGNAVKGKDYKPLSGTVHFNAGESTAFIEVTLINDRVPEGRKQLGIELDKPATLHLGASATDGFVIVDNDDRSRPALAIASPKNGWVAKSSTLAIWGTAADNTGVKRVIYQLDNPDSPWRIAFGTTQWSIELKDLTPGVHTLRLLAQDELLNESKIAVLTFTVRPPVVFVLKP